MSPPSPPPPAKLMDRAPLDGWGTLKRFVPYLWPAERPDLKRRIVGAMLFVLLAKATTLTLPYVYKRAVDAMTTPANAAAMAAMAFVIAYALGRLAAVTFDNLRNITFEKVGQDATRSLTQDTFARLHQLSLRFHLSRRTGEVTKTIERGTRSIDTMLYFLLFNIAPTVIELTAVAVIFWLHFGPGLVAATGVTVVAYILITRKITEWRSALREKMNELDGTALARAVDSLLNYETVKYFGAEDREIERYGRATSAYAEAALRSENSLGLLNIAQAVIMNLLMGFAMAYTVWGWSQGRLTTGDLVFVNTYLTQLFRPLDMLGMVYRTIRQGLIDMAAMFRLMDTEAEVKDAPGAPALIVKRPSVVFDHVVFGYEPDRTILHGLTFEVPAGSSTAIVGPSGAGKSTIARLLFRFYDPQAGRILIDGQDIARVTQESLRAQIGIVPQDSVLFNDTIGYNIAYGRGGATPRGHRPRFAGRGHRAVHRQAAAGLRDRGRRARAQALGGRKAARRNRAHAGQEPADPAARRGHQRIGQPHRAGHPRHAAPDQRAPHHARHRAPPLDHRRCRSHPGARERQAGRGRHPHRAASPRRALCRHVVAPAGRERSARSGGVAVRESSACGAEVSRAIPAIRRSREGLR